jgi:outer membrane protein W
MKKLLFLSAFIAILFTASSQSESYKAFKVDVGFGYAIPSGGSGTKGGISFTIEPHYRLTDEIAVGVRFEGAAIGVVTEDANGESNVDVSLLNSYCATGEYYFKKSGFRPFAGAGLGIFTQSSVSINTGGGDPITVPGVNKFGFFPTLGFEAGHFRMSGSYNILGEDASYLAFKIGFFLGGGKK